MWMCRICGIPIENNEVDQHAEKHSEEYNNNVAELVTNKAMDELVKIGFVEEAEDGFRLTEKGIEEQKRRLEEEGRKELEK